MDTPIGAILVTRHPESPYRSSSYVSFGQPLEATDSFGVPLGDIDEFMSAQDINDSVLDELFQNTFEVLDYALVYKEVH